MSQKYKYQEEFAHNLAQQWLDNESARIEIRKTIRSLKNKAQSSYIAARMAFYIMRERDPVTCQLFLYSIHPDKKD